MPSLGGPPPWNSPRSTEAIEKSVAQPSVADAEVVEVRGLGLAAAGGRR
ncbi:MAG: hypothetical protein WKF78_11305 [Candidatus Limnocylindrales bacterium]